MNLTNKSCWICGDTANSREHKIKKSDLKSVAGNFSQSAPIYIQTAKRKNKKIGSLDAKALKYEPSLCQFCNNTRTQPHDLAWQYLTEALRFRQPEITVGEYIRSNKIFPYCTKHFMRHVHLYMVKQFGCMLIEGKVKGIDIQPFSNAILNSKIHPNIYIVFGPSIADDSENTILASSSDLEAKIDKTNGQCVTSAYIHHIGNLWVRVMYAIDGEIPQGLKGAWNPKFGSKRLLMGNFK